MHERALNLVYNGTPNVSFDKLLVKGKSVSIHQKNNFCDLPLKVSKLKMEQSVFPQKQLVHQFIKVKQQQKPSNLFLHPFYFQWSVITPT